MAGFLWKPQSEHSGKLVVLTPSELTGGIGKVYVVTPNGQRVEGRFSSVANGGRAHWRFDQPGGAFPSGSYVVATRDGGGAIRWNIGNPAGRNEGGGGEDFSDENAAFSGGGGGAGGMTTGGDQPYTPPGTMGGGSIGAAAGPFYNPNFPAFQPVSFPSIQPAPFNFTDPQEFAEGFGEFNRGEIQKNFGQAQGMALEALQTELQGLKAFAPAAAALKREQISADNVFNQQQRTQQVNQVLPEARGDLLAQRGRAQTYAQGQLPFADRALELGIRSRAADSAGFSGIGPRSMQAEKVSDLMSAEDRFKIAQYGEGLVGQNLQQRAGLFLAPTEYSNAGSEIRVMPEVGAGRLTYQGLDMINQETLLQPAQALTAKVGQEQFQTGIIQDTNKFNAEGQFAAQKFNSTGSFTAGLGQFGYDTAYLAQLQNQNQINLNAATAAATGGMGAGTYDAGLSNGQAAGTINSAAQGVGMIPSTINAISSLFGSGGAEDKPLGGSPQTGDIALPETTSPSSQTSTEPITQEGVNLSSPEGGTGIGPLVSNILGSGLDSATPATIRLPAGSSVPSGYVSGGSNPDGSVSAINPQGYAGDLERFARFAGAPSGSISVQNAAQADRALTASTGLSYVALPNLQPVALTSSGHQLYSTPQAASDGNFTLGRSAVDGLGITLAMSGVDDGAALSTLSNISAKVSDPALLSRLDSLHATKGEDAVGQAILNSVVGEKPNLKSAAGQQLVAGAARIGQVWGALSPAQKSLALSSLAAPAANLKSGKVLGKEVVPGTADSPSGPLRVSDVASLNASGRNGFSVARNYNQMSAIADMVGVKGSPSQIARISDHIGLTGFGPQGAAVPVQPHSLAKAGAIPVPALGVGAVLFKNKADVPQNYQVLSSEKGGRIIAAPKNLTHTSPLSNGMAPLAYKKSKEIMGNNHPAQRNWGSPPSRGVARGAAGGSAIVSSLAVMEKSNPALFSGVVAHSMFNNTVGV